MDAYISHMFSSIQFFQLKFRTRFSYLPARYLLCVFVVDITALITLGEEYKL
jgi:hypothetical protein